MSLKQLQFGTALRILLQTAPILLVRLGLYLLFWVAFLIYIAIVAGLAYLLGRIWEPLTVIILLIALVATWPIYRLVNRYVFYLIKAAHLAVIAELLANGSLPPGASQLAWGKQQVTSRFGEVSAMFLVDELVAGVVRTFTNMVVSFASWLPGDSFRTLAQMAARVIRYATHYIDEAILARAFWRRDESVWQAAQEGVVLYGMVWKPLLVNAFALMLLSYVPFFVAFVLLAAPIGFLLGSISPLLGAWSIVFVLVLSLLVKVALGDSFAMIAMVAAYQRETMDKEPDPAMEARLASVSDRFIELKNRALASVRPSQPQPVDRLPDLSQDNTP